MLIPEKVRTALLKCGLSASDWQAVRAAFAATPAPSAADTEWIRAAGTAAKLEKLINEISAREPMSAEPVPDDLPALEEWAIRRAVERYGHLGGLVLAQKLGIGKTTLYRKLQLLRIDMYAFGRRVRPLDDILADIRALVDQIPAAAKEKAVQP